MSTLVIISLLSIGYGAWVMSRAARVAEQNKRFIESGEETYFEQRRSWEAYDTTPPTTAVAVVRRGRKEIAFGVLGLTLAAVLYLLKNGAN